MSSGPLLVIPGAISAGRGFCFTVAASLSSETPEATSAPLQDNIHVVCLVHLAPDDPGEGPSPASGVQHAERWRRGNEVLLWSALLSQLRGPGCEMRRHSLEKEGSGRNAGRNSWAVRLTHVLRGSPVLWGVSLTPSNS